MSEPDAVSQIEAILLDEIDDLANTAVHGVFANLAPAIRQTAIRIAHALDPARER